MEWEWEWDGISIFFSLAAGVPLVKVGKVV
jgi:hypothetical protein